MVRRALQFILLRRLGSCPLNQIAVRSLTFQVSVIVELINVSSVSLLPSTPLGLNP